jgi:hypothetical protein
VPHSTTPSFRIVETATAFQYRVRSSKRFCAGSLRILAVRWRGRPVVVVIGRPLLSHRIARLQSIIFPKALGWTHATTQAWIQRGAQLRYAPALPAEEVSRT